MTDWYAQLEECHRELYTANRLVEEARDEIEVLTTERDNALLRVEELERDVEYWRDIARSSLWVYPDV